MTLPQALSFGLDIARGVGLQCYRSPQTVDRAFGVCCRTLQCEDYFILRNDARVHLRFREAAFVHCPCVFALGSCVTVIGDLMLLAAKLVCSVLLLFYKLGV